MSPASPSPIRILLVEDEPLYAHRLSLLVRGLGYGPVGPFETGEEALDAYRALPRPDVALLDINLAGDLDGVDLAHELLAVQPLPIIFITARVDALTFARAKAIGPSAYLLKPFDERTLEHAVALALHNFAGGLVAQGAARPEEVPINWGADVLIRNCLFVRDRGRLTKVCLEDIYYVEAGEKYCTLVTAHGKYTARHSLRELALELPAGLFVQTQRAYLVNANHIEHVDPVAYTLTVAGTNLPLSRSYREALLRQLRLLS